MNTCLIHRATHHSNSNGAPCRPSGETNTCSCLFRVHGSCHDGLVPHFGTISVWLRVCAGAGKFNEIQLPALTQYSGHGNDYEQCLSKIVMFSQEGGFTEMRLEMRFPIIPPLRMAQ